MLQGKACRLWCVPSTDNIWQLEGPPGHVNCPIPHQTAVILWWRRLKKGDFPTNKYTDNSSSFNFKAFWKITLPIYLMLMFDVDWCSICKLLQHFQSSDRCMNWMSPNMSLKNNSRTWVWWKFEGRFFSNPSIHWCWWKQLQPSTKNMQEVQSASIQVGGGNQEHLNFHFGWCDCGPGAFVLRNHQHFLQSIYIVIAIRIDQRLWFFFAAFSCCFWFCYFEQLFDNNFITIMTKEAVGYFEIHHAPAPGPTACQSPKASFRSAPIRRTPRTEGCYYQGEMG